MAGLLLGAQIVQAQTDSSPVISHLEVSPLVGYRETLVTLRLNISDPRGLENIEETLYIVRNGVETMKARMVDDGSRGDPAPGDGQYTARIRVPPNASFQTHEFQVYVQNKKGERSNTLYYAFRVLSRGFDL